MTALDELGGFVRRVRAAYDEPRANGERARIRRAATVADVLVDEAFWTLLHASGVERTLGGREEKARDWLRRSIAQTVLLFPAAASCEDAAFSLGGHLRQWLHADEDDEKVVRRALGFRRLLAARPDEPDDVVHQLRRLLRHASAKAASPALAAVDFGRIARDLAMLPTERGDRVRATWAQDFYAGIPERESAAVAVIV